MSEVKLITCNGVLLGNLVDQNSLLHKEPVVQLYSEQYNSTPHLPIMVLLDPFQSSPHLRLGLQSGFFSLDVLTNILYEFLKHIIDGEIERMRRRGRILKQVVQDIKEKNNTIPELKDKSLDCNLWIDRFRRFQGPIARQIIY